MTQHVSSVSTGTFLPLINPKLQGQVGYQDRLSRVILLIFSLLTDMSLDRKQGIALSEKKIMEHANKQGSFIRSEARWGVVASTVMMAVIGASVLPQLSNMKLDQFSQAGQQITDKLLSSNYQPKGLTESSLREIELQKLQTKTSEKEADRSLRDTAQNVESQVLRTRENASRAGG